jgi:hypothetical protein
MSDPKDKKPRVPTPGTEQSKPESGKTSGRVAFDARGNPIWEWETSTGIYGRDVSTQRLKKLEAKDLAIVDTPPAEAKKAAKKGKELSMAEPIVNRETGFNPYNSSSAISPRKVADQPRKPVKDLRKLDEWIKMKKGLKDKDK